MTDISVKVGKFVECLGTCTRLLEQWIFVLREKGKRSLKGRSGHVSCCLGQQKIQLSLNRKRERIGSITEKALLSRLLARFFKVCSPLRRCLCAHKMAASSNQGHMLLCSHV